MKATEMKMKMHTQIKLMLRHFLMATTIVAAVAILVIIKEETTIGIKVGKTQLALKKHLVKVILVLV